MPNTPPTKLRIVVTGLAATYPFGGVFWDYFQYVLGFHRLGHDVLYIEDTGKWVYDPTAQTFSENGRSNANALARQIATVDADLAQRWFFRDSLNRTYGRTAAQVAEFCKSADLFLHISASCWMRDEYFAAKRVAFIDSDPMYTQSAVPTYLDGTVSDESRGQIDMLRQHHVFFTFAENIGQPDSKVPTELFNWIPTRQPVVMDCFAGHGIPVKDRRQVLTTVASWEPQEKGPTLGGIWYRGKSTEFTRFMEMPSRSKLPLEVAISGPAPRKNLKAAGWQLREGYDVSRDPWIYRQYLADSAGEWSVAKNAYVAGRTGWFSCRTACYLALGVPAVVQDTGFSKFIPSGKGLIAFDTMDQAQAGIESLLSDPQGHADAAIEIAHEYFDSAKVLTRLIELARIGNRSE